MVTYIKGNIFKTNAQIITNPVNCVGVMGKGLAKDFKKLYPDMFNDYTIRCRLGKVRMGKPYLYENILNFPTKKHYHYKSNLSDIEEGLIHLSLNYKSWGINSIALPALGCGLGGLNWLDIKPLIEAHLGSLSDLEVYVYLVD